MASIGKNYYYNRKGEKKVNSYKINIPKEVVNKSDITDTDNVKIYTSNGKIIIEKVSKGA